MGGVRRQRGIDSQHVLGIMVVSVPLGIIGARLFHVLDNLGYYWHHPPDIGTALHRPGHLRRAGRGPGLSLLSLEEPARPEGARRHRARLPDRAAHRALRQYHQRRHLGLPDQAALGFRLQNPHALLPANLLGVPTQPTPVYEQLWLLVMIGVLLYLLPRLKVDGLAILAYLGLYSFGRFFISFYRG